MIPVADGAMNEVMAEALTQRAELMEERAMTLAEEAVECKVPWLKRLGAVPTTEVTRRRWLYEVGTVAAYRDRYGVDGRRTLGEPRNVVQKLDAARAEQAIKRARTISEEATNAQDGRSRAVERQGRALA